MNNMDESQLTLAKVDLREVLEGNACFRLQFIEDVRAKEMKWVLFTDSRRGAIGKLIFTLEANNSAHVKVIDIHQNYRNMGLSKILFLACMATLAQRNVHELCLEAEEDTRRHKKLVGLYESWGFSVKENAKILFLYNDTQSFRKVPMTLPLQSKCFIPLEPVEQDSFCMLSLRTMDGVFVVASEDGLIDTTTGKSRDVFWQTMLLGTTSGDDIKGGTICLRSAHGKFLCVEPVGTVLADRFVNSTWETFDVLPHPSSGGVALRSYHGNYLGLDDARGLAISPTPVAWDGEAMNLLCQKEGTTPVHVKIMRKYQTMAFARAQRQRFATLDRAVWSIDDACRALLALYGEAHCRCDSRVLKHMLHDAEAVRAAGHPDWLQLIVFLRGLGLLFLLWADEDTVKLRSTSVAQWLHATPTWATGRPIPDTIAHAALNELNPDHSKPSATYEAHGGLAQVIMPWTPEEYMYHVLLGNDASLPEDALPALRYFSCDVWHTHEAYTDLASPADGDVQDLLRELHTDRQSPSATDLARMDVDATLPYYLSLSAKYLPPVLRW
ncbi:inositol oxygenase [Achlya hypogyna]|uniref:Inositol oxygenase n=1 Tax=Achlya hypogyna TaxID=1202772 RepID=A0A1V9Z501_ACHHY|nr:inositol oxygenase [Achlya hypogyna]